MDYEAEEDLVACKRSLVTLEINFNTNVSYILHIRTLIALKGGDLDVISSCSSPVST